MGNRNYRKVERSLLMWKPGKQITFRHLLTNSWELYLLELIFCEREWLTSPCSEWWENLDTKHSTQANINQSHRPPGCILRVWVFFVLWSLCSDGSMYLKHTFQICIVSASSQYLGLFSNFTFLNSFMTPLSPKPPCMRAKSLQSCPTLFVTPWIVVHQLLCPWDSPGKNTGGLSFPSPGDLPNPGIKPESLPSPTLAGAFFTTSAAWEAPESHVQSQSHLNASYTIIFGFGTWKWKR